MIWLVVAIGAVLVVFLGIALVGAPYVPSHRNAVRQAFSDLRKIKETDVVVDLGCGDGLVMRQAAQYDSRVIGVELNPFLAFVSWLTTRRYRGRVQVVFHDMWTWRLPRETTLVYVFSVSRDVKRLARKMQSEANRLGRPLQLLSYGAVVSKRHVIDASGGHALHEFTPLHKNEA